MVRVTPLFLILSLTLLAVGAWAHPGRLDANGGHVDRSSGEYHCHRADCKARPSASRSAPAARSAKAPQVGLYQRSDWPHWRDEDGDCQDTRAEVLIRDSLIPVTFADPRGCVVLAGLWQDPYSGARYDRAEALSIDHQVALQWAHGHGGEHWSRTRKTAFANDLDNLVVVEAGLNQAKGAKGPDDWLPPREAARCGYLEGFLRTMRRYDLRFVDVEYRALQGAFLACDIDAAHQH